ncbi:MAG: 4-alpha-glucanotransferase [Nitrospirae bacterium]|nr:4-alpha-glucanotransferase [Nitrospirota bacterium]
MNSRKSGILLHITSLPSLYGIGDLGPSAYQFADLLAESKQCIWQVLPVNPTSISNCNSPYSSESAFAGNALLISPELLENEGFLSRSDLLSFSSTSVQKVDFKTATGLKRKMLDLVYQKNRASFEKGKDFNAFCDQQAEWLENYALFKVLKAHFQGKPWNHFTEELVNRDPRELERYREKFEDQIVFEKMVQFLFFKQWYALKQYCNQKEIRIFGDVPIYVQYDSADVWTHSGIFQLDANRRPLRVAGVPPDYFSKTGQLWGNPVYEWEAIKATHYSWWIQRLAHNLSLFDMVRLDHFRGYVAYWSVLAGQTTAERGEWVPAPSDEFFRILLSHFSNPCIIAEDLGVITPDVTEVMERFKIPGMKVLLFAFGENLPSHPFLPHNYSRNAVVYTGTHDTSTVREWFKKEAGIADRTRLSAYLGRTPTEETVHLEMIRLAMMSVADAVIIPMQDILGLGEGARMNLPGSLDGNWEWRLLPEQLDSLAFKDLAAMTWTSGRSPASRRGS